MALSPHRVRRTFSLWFWMLVLAACDPGSGDGACEPPEEDPRCTAICTRSSECEPEQVDRCIDVCMARIADMTPICKTCLLEDAGLDSCGDPHYPNNAEDCAQVCVDT